MSSFQYTAAISEFDATPEAIHSLLSIWHNLKASGSFPLKSELDPVTFKNFLGRLCVVDIQHEPLDFIYRLDGTEISAASNEDLAGCSILKGTPNEIYQSHFEEFKIALDTAKPMVWQISYVVPESEFDYYRVILPFSRDKQSISSKPDLFITYCHSRTSDTGSFKFFRQLSTVQ
ncbi:PAS domain-containing protein [Kiloniella antarctica]|uniref:PAS domain-containing protein n=1 Tax=Kiloniella antarctica TaxID=1550907 RepID=A0ABW5BFQ6_9PROT